MNNNGNNIYHDGKKLYVAGQVIDFGIPIEEIALMKEEILVLLNKDEAYGTKYENRNIVCIEFDGQCKWIIEARGGRHKEDPFVGISEDYEKIDENKAFAGSWMGMKYEINMETGYVKEIKAYR